LTEKEEAKTLEIKKPALIPPIVERNEEISQVKVRFLSFIH